MEQKRPLLVTSEEHTKLPILIVDKKGTIGSSLTKVLRDQFLVVVVTAYAVASHQNVIHVPYYKKIPMIPDHVYSHIFVIYNGESEILEMLSAFEEKAQAVKAKLFFITSLFYSSHKVFTYLARPEFQTFQTVLFGETFDNEITEANEINFFIHQARIYGRIEVPKEGLGQLYPVSLDDVLSSIVSLAFAAEKQTKTIFIFPHHVFTEIFLARSIQKINPLIKIDFGKKKSKALSYYIPPEGLYFFRNYNLEERLRRIDFSREKSRSSVPQKKIQLKMPNPTVAQNRSKFFLVILLAVFIAPLLLTLFCAVAGAAMLSLSFKQVEQGSLSAAESSATIAKFSFAQAQTLAPSLVLPQLLTPVQKSQFLDTMQTGESVAVTDISLVHSLQVMQNIYEKKSADPKNDFLHALATLKNTLLTLQKLEAEKKLPQPIIQKMSHLNGTLNLVEGTIDTWPSLLGFEGGKTYLILFQNNMELRPGGGFIGSYGILPVKNGSLEPLQIHDVYDADGKLAEHVEPPYGLRRYLGASHWFLRDSNFDPDFVRDAVQAQQFLQKETGQKVDGVIAIDTTFLKNLIAIVGSVEVPDYKERVTPDNFYLLTQVHAEKNFFPGSTQKKDFLRSLTNALMTKLFSQKRIPYEKLAQMVTASVRQKHLLFAFADSGVQNVFTANGLSSSLRDGRRAEKNTAFDYVGIVDANIGANKANYYVKRAMNQSVAIDELGGQQTTIEAAYSNTSSNTSSFGGNYKDYVRFVVPVNSTLTSVQFDKKERQTVPAITESSLFASSGFIPPTELEVEQVEEQGKKVIGFFFLVPPGATKTVGITYSTPSSIDVQATAFMYNLRLFKQPGTVDDPYHLSVSYPNTVKVVTSTNGLTDVGGKLTYDTLLTEDKDLVAGFSKK